MTKLPELAEKSKAYNSKKNAQAGLKRVAESNTASRLTDAISIGDSETGAAYKASQVKTRLFSEKKLQQLMKKTKTSAPPSDHPYNAYDEMLQNKGMQNRSVSDTSIDMLYMTTPATPKDDKPGRGDAILDFIENNVNTAKAQQIQEITDRLDLLEEIFTKHQLMQKQHIDGQKYTISTLSTWSRFIDAKLKEQKMLNARLVGLNDTQSRESVFSVDDIKTLDSWKRGVTVCFGLLVGFIILIAIIQHYRTLSGIAQRVGDFAAKKISRR